MADEKNIDKATGEDKGPAPAINPEELQAAIAAGVKGYIEAHGDELPQRQVAHQQQQSRPEAQENPLSAVIDPVINPRLRALDVKATAAYDASLFYATTPEAIRFKDDVEKAFNTMVEQGTPLSHQAVWEWYKGKNEEKFYQERAEKDRRKLEAAKEFSTVEGGIRPSNATPKDAHSATDDELRTGLKDVAF